MAELRVTLDPLTGALLVEDHRLPGGLAADLATLLGTPRPIACARPAEARSPAPLASTDGHATGVRVAGYWHASLVDGPGRRSVAKLQGCPIHCAGCLTPDSWDPARGTLVPVDRLADALLDPAYPRDGVSVVGGEPFFQPEGLVAVLEALRHRGCQDLLAYSGYTYERLQHLGSRRPAIGRAIALLDILVDGPYLASRAADAGPWTGSGNQRVIDLGATRRTGCLTLLGAPDGNAGR